MHSWMNNGAAEQPDIWIARSKRIAEKAIKPQPREDVCPNCLGNGVIPLRRPDGTPYVIDCGCMANQQLRRRVVNSGIAEHLVKMCSFESFHPDSPALERMKQIAADYAKNPTQWLYLSGTSGCGKTHLAVAAAVELMKQGQSVVYMNFSTEITVLKRVGGNPEERDKRIREAQSCPVLVLDDLLSGSDKPSAADVQVAFEILSKRYERGLPTILTSKWSFAQLSAWSEPLGSRIYQRSKHSAIHIKEDSRFNYRLRKN